MRGVHKGQHYLNKADLSLCTVFKRTEGRLEELSRVYLSLLNLEKALGALYHTL